MDDLPRAAAIYARISSDVEGSGLGVTRQLQDCRSLVKARGWGIGQEYVDNDLSAYTGKARPGFQRMLDDIKDGIRDGVMVYHPDRISRDPLEFERFLANMRAAGIRHIHSFVGDLDIGSDDGLVFARLFAALAAGESATKSRRVRRKLDEIAAAGKPHGGYQRPFGYEADKITVRPAEAVVIRELAARFIAGESAGSLCTWLDETGIRTINGKPWRTPTLRAMLASGRIAGLRRHRGEIVGPAVWQAIITPGDRDKILARMAQVAMTKRRTPQRYLLSGLLRCGRCSGTLFSSPRATTRRYVCLSGPDHGGCGGITVTAVPLESLITDAVLYRLDTPELAAALAGRAAADAYAAAAADSLAEDRALREELADLYATKQINATDWGRALRIIEDRVRDSERQLSRAIHTEAIVGLARGDALSEQWSGLAFSRRTAVVRAVVDHAVIRPGTPGAQSLDRNRVQIVWRL